MKKSLLDLSGKIEGDLIELCEAVVNKADSLDIPFFVVGAYARDIVLHHGHGIRPQRLTEDVDFGIQVSDWGQFRKLTDALISTGDFKLTKQTQRFVHKNGLLIDIVPFGPIEDGHRITWPPENAVIMNVLGFQEAFEHSQSVKLRSNPDLIIPVATPAGLAIMKIIAWKERTRDLRGKDAKDLALLLQNYMDAGNEQRLYDEEPDLLEEDGYDYTLAGARLLGRDMAGIARPETKRAILVILDAEAGERGHYPLVEDMTGLTVRAEIFEENLKLLEAMKAGFREG